MRVDGQTVAGDSCAVEITVSSMSIEIKGVSEAILYLKESQHRKSVNVTDSLSTLQKVKKKFIADGISSIKDS